MEQTKKKKRDMMNTVEQGQTDERHKRVNAKDSEEDLKDM
jgi:hypothetical protein